MYGIFIYRGYHYENIELSFLNRIYSRCNLKDIAIIEKIWFDYRHCYFFLWELYCRNGELGKFLYL